MSVVDTASVTMSIDKIAGPDPLLSTEINSDKDSDKSRHQWLHVGLVTGTNWDGDLPPNL